MIPEIQSHWSHLDGNTTVTWSDSHLHPDGVEQARALGRTWVSNVAQLHVPLPQIVYTSPLARALQTTRLAFGPVFSQQQQQQQQRNSHEQPGPLTPHVDERLRERVTDHTCDRRSTRGWIARAFPEAQLGEAGLATDEDAMWTGGAGAWETEAAHESRVRAFLEDVFGAANGAADRWAVALVTHSFTVSALLAVLGMRPFRMAEGSCVAVVVRGERVVGM